MNDVKTYLNKEQTGLPFWVITDNQFKNYSAWWDNGLTKALSVSDLINIHLLVEIRNNKPKRKTK